MSLRPLSRWLLVPLLFACSCLHAAGEPLRVVALHAVLGEFAQRLGGEAVAVRELVPGGADFHSYSPSPTDVKHILAADLLLANGFEVEPYLERLVRNSGTKARIVEAVEQLRSPLVLSAEGHEGCTHAGHSHGEVDPHWWHGLGASGDVASGIAAALAELLPGEAERIRARLALLLAELDALGAWARAELAPLPPDARHLVTSHDAFGYLAREHAFQVHAVSGVNPEAEADARSLARLIDFVSKNKIRAIFADNTENPRVLAAMTRETGAVKGRTLLADGPGEPEGPAGTHAAMYRHNVSAIAAGLLGRPGPATDSQAK